jgi:hypothetical protein
MKAMMVVAALLTATSLARAADDLPANSAAVAMKPTANGYETSIIIPRDKFADAQVTSTDPEIQRILGYRVNKEERAIPPKPEQGAQQKAENEVKGKIEKATEATAQGNPKLKFVTLVTVMLDKGAVRQGQYPFTLRLMDEHGGTIAIRDLLLTVPASKVDPIDTLVILRRMVWNGWALGSSTTANRPQLWETTRHSWLTDIKIAQKGDTDGGADPAGWIKPTEPIANVAPGGNALIELNKNYELEGPFPLGTAKGKLVVNADQLAEPVTFNFEVRSRVWVGILFIPMVLGICLGWLTRVRLTKVVNVNQAREKAYALVTLIGEALSRNDDQEFRTAAILARDGANAAALKSKADEVTAGTTGAQTAFQNALDNLTHRRGELDKKIGAVLAVAGASYRLPAAMADELKRVRSIIDAGLPGLEKNDVAGATAAYGVLLKQLHDETLTRGIAWLKQIGTLQDVIESLAPLVGAAAAKDLNSELQPILTAISGPIRKLEEDTANSVEAIKAVLDAWHSNIYTADQFLDYLAVLLDRQFRRFDDLLEDKPLPNEASWNAWVEQAQKFKEFVRGVNAMEPDEKLNQIVQSADELFESLGVALREQITDPAKLADLDALLKAKKGTEAVANVAQILHLAPITQKTIRVMQAISLGTRVGKLKLEEPLAYIRPSGAAPSTAYAYVGPQRSELPSTAILTAMARRKAETAGWILTLICGLVIVGAGYFLFAGKWIGTPLDFATVFSWGYVTDIGADAATTAAKGVKP